MTPVIAILMLCLGLCLGAGLGHLLGRRRPAPSPEQAAIARGLDQLHERLHHLDVERSHWRGHLDEQVASMRHTTDQLRLETRSLSTALRRPQVRGRWGELHLRRAVELAGLVDRCDFTEQAQVADGAQRPDLVVHLVGGREVVVDAKVPLDAYLDATGAEDEEEHLAHLRRHARQLRHHVDSLAGKAYWRSLASTPEFVVLFVPAESFLAAALETDPALLDDAAAKNVVLATPTTLIALLRTVAYGWRQEAVADQAREIHRLGRELHERIGRFGQHLDQLGRSLNGTVERYNQAVGSWESRVLVSARRFEELAVTDDTLDDPRRVAVLALPPHRRGSTGEADERPSVVS